MQVTGTWNGQRHFTAVGPSGHEVSMDASADVGGQGLGNRPMELLLMGLVGCTGIDVSLILERMRQPLSSLRIEASGTRRDEMPQSFTHIELTYHIEGNIDPNKARRAVMLSHDKYCSATASLNAMVRAVIVLNGERLGMNETPD